MFFVFFFGRHLVVCWVFIRFICDRRMFLIVLARIVDQRVFIEIGKLGTDHLMWDGAYHQSRRFRGISWFPGLLLRHCEHALRKMCDKVSVYRPPVALNCEKIAKPAVKRFAVRNHVRPGRCRVPARPIHTNLSKPNRRRAGAVLCLPRHPIT